MSLGFDPLLPAWLLAVLAIAVAGVSTSAYRQLTLPAGLRLLALLSLLVLAANPVLRGSAERRELPVIAVVSDASLSMARSDVPGGRLAVANQALAAVAAAAGSGVRSEYHLLRTTLTPGQAETAAAGTDFAALADLADLPHPPLAVVFASDGGDRGSNEPAARLAAAGITAWAIAVGTPQSPDNAWIRLEAASPATFPGQTLALNLQVGATGAAIGRQAEVVVSDGGDQELLRTTVRLTAQARVPLTVEVDATLGPRRWLATVADLGDEITVDDNRSWAVTQVVDRPLRVAVIEGQPFWDTTYAVRAWRRDQQIQVGAVYRLGRRAFRSGTAEDLPDADTLAAHDVVVIGVDAGTLLDDATQERLLDAVRQGVGLLLIGVHEGLTGPLAAADPLLRSGDRHRDVTVAATAAGQRLALTGDEPIAGVTLGRTAGLRALSEILVGSDHHPAVVWRRHGAGRVAAVNAEGLWRLSLGSVDSEAPARFWRALLKALVADAGTAIAADRNRYHLGQTARLAVRDPGPLAVTPPSGTAPEPNTIAVNDGTAHLLLDRPGLWRLGSGTDAIDLVVDPDVGELVDSARRDDSLRRLVDGTGGDLVEAEAAAELGARLRRRAELLVPTPTATPLVPGTPLVLVVILLLGAEWFLRRRRHGVV